MAGRSTDISSAHNAVAINLAADTSLAAGCRGFTVGTAGDVKVDYVGGATAITLKNRVAGVDHGHQISKIYSTANGTTAADVVAYY
jgi:hypothetical protein